MELTIGGLTITGQVPEEQVNDFRIAPSSELQVTKPIQATAASGSGSGAGGGLHADLFTGSSGTQAAGVQMFDRGNYLHLLTFQIARVHDSGDAAEAFLITHLVAVEAVGVDTLKYTNTAGTFYFVPAFALVVDASTQGCSSFVKYKITGGRLSSSPGGTVGGVTAD